MYYANYVKQYLQTIRIKQKIANEKTSESDSSYTHGDKVWLFSVFPIFSQ